VLQCDSIHAPRPSLVVLTIATILRNADSKSERQVDTVRKRHLRSFQTSRTSYAISLAPTVDNKSKRMKRECIKGKRTPSCSTACDPCSRTRWPMHCRRQHHPLDDAQLHPSGQPHLAFSVPFQRHRHTWPCRTGLVWWLPRCC
jgi:hypothetical protein